MSLKIKIHKKRTKSNIRNSFRLVDLFGSQIWPWENQLKPGTIVLSNLLIISRISYKCIKIVDLFFQGHTGCPKCQICHFLTFLTFGYSIWPWKNKSMYFEHFLKDAQLSTVLITIWTSTFHRFSQGQICGPKRSTSRELFLMSDFVRFLWILIFNNIFYWL